MSTTPPFIFAGEYRGANGPQGEPGADGADGAVGPSGGPFPDLTGVAAGQVAQTTGGGGVVFTPLPTAYLGGGAESSTRRVSAHPDGLLGATDGLAAFCTDPFGTGTVTLVGDSTMHDPGLAFDSKRAFYQFAQMLSVQYPGIYMRYFRHDGALGSSMFFRAPIDVNTPSGVGPVYWDNTGAANYQPWVLVPRARQGVDLDRTIKIEPTAWTGATQHVFFVQDENAVSDKEIMQGTLQSDGTLRLRWWDTPGHVAGTATGTVPITPPSSGPLFLRYILDSDLSDTGAGTGWSVTFKTSTDGFTWTTVQTLTNGTPTTIRKAATARLYFGYGGGGTNNMVGKLYEMWDRAFIDGPLIPGVPYCVSAWRSTTVPIYKSQMQGGPQLDFFNGSWPGKSIADTFDNPDYFPWLMVPGNNLLHLINTNTNDSGLRGVLLRQQWASLLAHHRAVVPGARIVAINGVPSVLSSDTMPEKPVRAAQMATWLPTQGVPVIDTWRAWLEDGRAWTALNTGEHHPIDDGTLLDTNPVRRQAQPIFNAVMASSFATQNPATGPTALVRS